MALLVESAPPSQICVGYFQISSGAIRILHVTAPTGSRWAPIVVETQNIRYRCDSTAPTATAGMLLSTTASTPYLLGSKRLVEVPERPDDLGRRVQHRVLRRSHCRRINERS